MSCELGYELWARLQGHNITRFSQSEGKKFNNGDPVFTKLIYFVQELV